MHYYPYYPLLPIQSSYLYPPTNLHLHTQLTAIRHGHLLREQSQLEYFSRIRLDRERQYSNEVLQKQMRIANLMENNTSQILLERQMLEGRRLDEELRINEQFRRLERQRLSFFNQRNTQMKGQMHNESLNKQNTKDKRKDLRQKEQNSLGGEILNIKPKNYSNNPKEKQLTLDGSERKEVNYQSRKRQKIKSVARDISYNQTDQNLNDSNTYRKSSILKNSNKTHSPKLKKQKKVKFLNESPSFQANFSSYCLNNSALKDAHQKSHLNKNLTLKGSAQKKIQNRLKLSAIVYRDSQYRNVKHEIEHLINTYETECRLRKDVKNKINGREQIIHKYNLVTPQ